MVLGWGVCFFFVLFLYDFIPNYFKLNFKSLIVWMIVSSGCIIIRNEMLDKWMYNHPKQNAWLGWFCAVCLWLNVPLVEWTESGKYSCVNACMYIHGNLLCSHFGFSICIRRLSVQSPIWFEHMCMASFCAVALVWIHEHSNLLWSHFGLNTCTRQVTVQSLWFEHMYTATYCAVALVWTHVHGNLL